MATRFSKKTCRLNGEKTFLDPWNVYPCGKSETFKLNLQVRVRSEK